MKTKWIMLISLLSLALSSCSPERLPASPSAPAVSAASETPSLQVEPTRPDPAPTRLAEPTQTLPSPTSSPAGLEPMIKTARRDLASRLFVSIDQVSLLRVSQVNWANSGLGCPEPGLVYAQVITPGFLIILSSGQKEYEYHAGQDQHAFFCKNPEKPSLYDPNSF